MQAELLRRGAEQGEVIELVAAYEPYAACLAAWAGVAEHSTFRVADVLADPTTALPADVVVMNRVVCCSSEGVDLVKVAAQLCTGTLLLSYPRDTLLARTAAKVQHYFAALLRRKFEFFVRPATAFRTVAEAAGLEVVAGAGGLVWEYLAFRRPAS